MKDYISGVRSRMTFDDYPALVFKNVDYCLDDYVLCSLELNGSGEYKPYTWSMINKLQHEGCAGAAYIGGGSYTVYRVSKSGLSLMSCMKFCGIEYEIPKELNFLSTKLCSPFAPVCWKIPISVQNSGGVCFFSNADLGLEAEKFLDCSYVPNLILQYYKTAIKFGNMLNYNLDMLSSEVADYLDWDNNHRLLCGSFYYKDFKVFEGNGDEFDEKGYIDCNISLDSVYRLHNTGVFQYIGCPLYIDEEDNLYLLFYNKVDHRIFGVVRYKITDRKKFNSTISKSIFVDDINYVDMCQCKHEIRPSQVRINYNMNKGVAHE